MKKPSHVHPSSHDHKVRNPRPEKKKKLTIKVEVSEFIYKEATVMCELTDDEIKEMILNDGINGLRNYVAHQDNWK